MERSGDPRQRRQLLLAGFAAVALAAGLTLAETFIPRLSNHAGYYLVPVTDEVKAPIPARPRHTVFVLVDGLRRDSAETMETTRALAESGQCRITDQGGYTVSRPVYALMSTGLEVDRSGARNNEQTSPLAAESFWQVAHGAGLVVQGSSHLPWFRELFPDGFDRFTVSPEHTVNVFEAGWAAPDAELGDVSLFHPLYVDAAGHAHGARSAEYAAAVARADREIARLLDRLDPDQDLVVVTSDHGHRAEGGHGGGQPEIREVLTCFAGKNVARLDPVLRRPLDGRAVGPALSLLLGLRFPRDMRAGEDGLDAIFEIAQPGPPDDPQTEAYLADRRAAVEHFREENHAALARVNAQSWSEFYGSAARPQWIRLGLVAIAAAVLLGLRLQQQRVPRRALATGGFVVLAALTTLILHRLVLGAFDYTVVNGRSRYIGLALGIVVCAAAFSAGVHVLFLRSRARLAEDSITVTALLLLACLGHIFVFGWPLGFPLPGPAARYAYLFGTFALTGFAALALGSVLPALWRDLWLRRTGPAPAQPSTDQ